MASNQDNDGIPKEFSARCVRCRLLSEDEILAELVVARRAGRRFFRRNQEILMEMI